MSNSWTDELKAEVISEYTSKNPTHETTLDIVAELATKYDFTVNGVRAILSRGNVYVPIGKTTSNSSSETDKPKRKSKEESLKDLTEIMSSHGVEVDDAIVSKLTGKAAEFFIGAFKQVLEIDD